MSLSAEPEAWAGLDVTHLFDVSLDLLCIRDMQGRFVKLNPAWETTLGYSVDDLEGAALLQLIHPEDVARTRARMGQADRNGEIIGFVNRYRGRDGRYRHLEWRARRTGGFVFGVARDITDRIAVEAKLRAAAQARSELLAEMDREIRRSLDGIAGAASALDQTDLTQAQRELVRRITAASGMLELLSGALDASMPQTAPIGLDMKAFDSLAHIALGSGQVSADGPPARPAVEMRAGVSLDALRSRPNFQHAVRCWVRGTLRHFDANPAFHRTFRDFASQIIGFLAIHLSRSDHLHQRNLQAQGARTGFISPGRAAALLLRMQDIGFIAPAEAYRAGRARRYRPMPVMLNTFAERAMVDLRSAALIDPTTAAVVEGAAHDERATLALLHAFAEAILEESAIRSIAERPPLNGAPFMAMGKQIALSIAGDAMERCGAGWDGPAEIALTSYGHRFEVSRAHVRRVLQTLEPCGLARIEDDPHRLLLTSEFCEAIEVYYAIVFERVMRTIERFRAPT